MKAHPYIWLTLCILASIGMGVALHQATKYEKSAEHPRWAFWIVVMGILALADTAAIKWLSEE
jgi:hypothetical protein